MWWVGAESDGGGRGREERVPDRPFHVRGETIPGFNRRNEGRIRQGSNNWCKRREEKGEFGGTGCYPVRTHALVDEQWLLSFIASA